jgi:hypothetical protein
MGILNYMGGVIIYTRVVLVHEERFSQKKKRAGHCISILFRLISFFEIAITFK